MTKQVLDLFTGTANPELADEVSKILGIKISKADVGYFSDGEIKVQIEDNVRGHDTFILQSTCAPSNKNLMELMFLADALKRSSASRITAIVPYYGYARQDRRVRSARVPISAKVVADMFYSVGIDRVLTVDLHSETIQGFFDMPADNVYATKLMVDDIKKNMGIDKQNSFWSIFLNDNEQVKIFYEQNIKKYKICLSGSGSSMFIKYNDELEKEKILKIIPSNWRFFEAKPLQYSPLEEFV